MRFNFRLFLLASAGASAIATAAHAETEEADPTTVSEVIVSGRGEKRIGTATAASEGAVAGIDLEVRPILRTAELIEAVPGMIATQHSGSGKANQYFLRGFNLDHGTDFGLFVDDVPLNFRTHGHGQGYLDVNILLPEAIRRIDYRKGPYRADTGDFTLVGMAAITTVDTFDAPFINVEAGAFDHKRLAAGASFEAAGGDLLLIGEAKTYDGPWQLPETFRPLTGYAKYTRQTPFGTLRASLSVYDATWRPTEQIPERAIGTLVDDAFGAIDLTLRGQTSRQIATVRLDGDDWKVSAYAQRYDWSMISNFTFFLDDPVNGDQLQQAEKLWTYGGRAERTFRPSEDVKILAGIEGRYEDIKSVGLYNTVDAVRRATFSQFGVDEASAALYAEANWSPIERLSLFAGARQDAYSFKVRAQDGGAWSGDVEDSLFSPKVGINYELVEGIAVYANWGRGFHSNDARGVTAPTDPAPGLVVGEGSELGVRFERGPVVLTANHWWMEVDSELIYVGDAGSVEPSSGSKRRGYELTAFWRPLEWLTVDAVWTESRARFVDSPGEEYIPGALESAGELGIAAIFPQWNAAVRVRHLGPHPMIEDNSIRAAPTTIVNLRAAWTPGRYEVYAELLNVLDSDKKDIEYWYESYLPQIDLAGPVEDVHSRAVEPRMLRAGLKVSF